METAYILVHKEGDEFRIELASKNFETVKNEYLNDVENFKLDELVVHPDLAIQRFAIGAGALHQVMIFKVSLSE
jgi:hypothetical protein